MKKTKEVATKNVPNMQNPHSLIHLIEGTSFANAAAEIPEELWRLKEEELRAKVKPTSTDYALRVALWNEFRISCATNEKIPVKRIHAHICSYQHLWQNILGNPEKLAWLLQPLQEYEDLLKPLLVRVYENYSEILDMDVHDEDGRPVPALVKAKLRAMEQIEGRLCGEPVRRLESKSLSYSMHSDLNEKSWESMTVEERNLELARLNAKLKTLPGQEPTAEQIRDELKKLTGSEL